MIETVKISDNNPPLYKEFRELYQRSFPLFEQRTLLQQQAAFASPHYHLIAYIEDGCFIGFVSYWEFDVYIYIEHFAVSGNCRGKGYGSRILKEFTDKIGKTVILEIDPVTDDISSARLRFYLKCGFHENRYPHIHPPYRDGYKAHPLVILSTQRALSGSEYEAFNSDLKEVVMEFSV